jgi:ketosteroid isomerase-like protein
MGLKGVFLAASILLAAFSTEAKTKNEAANQADISKTLQASAAAWSRGDLAAFMQCYDDGPNTEYVKSTGVVEGFTAIRDMYASRYGNGSAHAMGRLSLEVTNYRQLGAAYALVTGRFALARAKSDGGDASGVFSLVFHRSAAGWHIVYDHSS